MALSLMSRPVNIGALALVLPLLRFYCAIVAPSSGSLLRPLCARERFMSPLFRLLTSTKAAFPIAAGKQFLVECCV